MKNDVMRPRLGSVCVALLPLAVWPDLARPFSDPKLAWLVACTLGLLVAGGSGQVGWATRGLASVWIAAFVAAGLLSPSSVLAAIVLGVIAPLFALAVMRVQPRVSAVVGAQVIGATACAAVALAQWAGADPFVTAGWHPPIDGASVRMRVYGTLGNPNFVGVVMAMSLPLTLAVLSGARTALLRRVVWGALGVQAGALVATGSRGAVLGLGTAVAIYALLRWTRRVRVGLAAVALFATAAIAVSPARPLDTTAAGRLHLWRIVGPHVWDAPLIGLGPGAVTVRFSAWQRAAARGGVRDPRFAGLTDHVHNDYLEALVERGVLGLLSVLGPLLATLVVVRRLPRPVPSVAAGALAAVAAGAACALVDFPLARPTELTWWWLAIAVSLHAARPMCIQATDTPAPAAPRV